MGVEDNKLLVRRLVDEAVAERNIDVRDELGARGSRRSRSVRFVRSKARFRILSRRSSS